MNSKSLPDWHSGIHCLLICRIQLLTLNILDATWKHIFSQSGHCAALEH